MHTINNIWLLCILATDNKLYVAIRLFNNNLGSNNNNYYFENNKQNKYKCMFFCSQNEMEAPNSRWSGTPRRSRELRGFPAPLRRGCGSTGTPCRGRTLLAISRWSTASTKRYLLPPSRGCGNPAKTLTLQTLSPRCSDDVSRTECAIGHTCG